MAKVKSGRKASPDLTAGRPAKLLILQGFRRFFVFAKMPLKSYNVAYIFDR